MSLNFLECWLLSHRLRRNSAKSESLLVRLPPHCRIQLHFRMLLTAMLLLRGLLALRGFGGFCRLPLQPFTLQPAKQLRYWLL